MNIFAKFDENLAIPLQVIKKTKRYGGRTDPWTDGQHENSIPHHKQVWGGYKNLIIIKIDDFLP